MMPTGIWARSQRPSDRPSSPGMAMSRMARWKVPVATAARMDAALSSAVTSKPFATRYSATASRRSGSSSTMAIRMARGTTPPLSVEVRLGINMMSSHSSRDQGMSARPVVALVCLRGEPGFSDYLERRGYEIRETAEEWAAEALVSRPDVDVAVIGEAFPPGSGLDLLRKHAGASGPSFVMIADRGDLIEKVLALELGAADVVPVAVHWRELAAR